MDQPEPTPALVPLPPRVRLDTRSPNADPFDALVGRFPLRFSPNTRTAYPRDLDQWGEFCACLRVHPLAAGLDHGDVFARWLAEERQLVASLVCQRLAGCASFYRYLVEARLLAESPFTAVARPKVTNETTSVGLT